MAEETPRDPASTWGRLQRAGEEWCAHYHSDYGVDVRCLRLPVIVQPVKRGALPNRTRPSPIPVPEQARPFLHIDDAVRAIWQLMAAPPAAIRQQKGYLVAGGSVALHDLVVQVLQYQPGASVQCWNNPELPGPEMVDTRAGRHDWGYQPRYNLLNLVRTLLRHDNR